MKNREFALDRRQFLKLGAASGAGIVMSIGFPEDAPGNPDDRAKHGLAADAAMSGAWIKLHPDNTVTVIVNHSEMGQGITTALPMIVAEELDADWSTVRFEIAPVADQYKHPHYGIQWTVSSRSVESSWQILRHAGASMRALLMAAAASRWGVEMDSCRSQKSRILHPQTGRSFAYSDLIPDVSKMGLPARVTLKTPDEFSLIGRRIPRLDGAAKVDGSACFGMDVRLPGMLAATVVHPPVYGAKAKSFNRQEISAMPGVRHILVMASGIAVVADTFWQASLAADRLKISWKSHKRERVSSEGLLDRRKRLSRKKGRVQHQTGDVYAVFKKEARAVEAAYELPYQAHATPEPMNCTADVKARKCDIFAPTQNQKGASDAAAKITGLHARDIHVHTTFIGGGFGRRALVDYVEEAVELSYRLKTPIKLIWTRNEDICRDYYRPSTYNVLRAVIDDKGLPKAWLHRTAGADAFGQALPKVVPSFLPEFIPQFVKNVIAGAAQWLIPRVVSGTKACLGAGPLPYRLDNMQVEFINDDPGIPICWWRSVAPSSNCFAAECFIDEIAAVSGRDPYELRCELLKDNTRMHHVLTLAAQKSGWGKRISEDRFQGMACHDFQNTVMAMVAEVSVSSRGDVAVHRVVCALDCGVVVNPKIIEAQIQSGIVFGMTAALKSEITISRGACDQSNFDDFPLLRYDEMPEVITWIVQSGQPPTGIGETAVPVIGPAIANAVFAATGRRIRRLPIRPADLV